MAQFLCDGPKVSIRTLREWNWLRAHTRVLPTEILSLVFSFVHTPVPQDKYPRYPIINLAAVCSFWRKIIFGTPQFWTFAIITFKDCADVYSKTGLLKRYLVNSGNLGLFIGLSFGLSFQDEECKIPLRCLVDPSVDRLIWENARRITSLDLQAPPSLNAWKLLILHLPHLQIFSFKPADSDTDAQGVLQLPGTPHLSHVYLKSFSGKIILPSDNITTLSLDSVPVERCFQLLFQCPNLTSYKMSNPTTSAPFAEDDGPRLWHETPTTLATLDEFYWEFCGSIWDVRMLEHIHAPVLRLLTWKEGECMEEEMLFDLGDSAKDFCERLPSSLERLVIERFGDDGLDVMYFLQGHSGLKEIVIYDDLFPEGIVHAVSILGPSEVTGAATPFPKLRELVIVTDYDRINLYTKRSAEILDTLLSRKKADDLLHVRFVEAKLFHSDPPIFPSEKMEVLRNEDKVRLSFESRCRPSHSNLLTPT